MSDKVYIVVGSSGSWEDSREWSVKAFLEKSKAEESMNKLNEKLKKDKIKNDEMERLNNECEDDCNSCEECKFDYSYTLEEQHDYKITTVELVI